jgi:transposase-like protein
MPRGRPTKCPYCGSKDTKPKGYRQTVTMGKRRIYACKGCKRRFTAKTKTTKKSK